jgi:hypothetical protein
VIHHSCLLSKQGFLPKTRKGPQHPRESVTETTPAQIKAAVRDAMYYVWPTCD